ncbi:MAG TPA: MOSC domain-containing protein [Patescibacteria group bacterium]|nr:MOSC domain-containing protein [Patescibacteria group bacterium]
MSGELLGIARRSKPREPMETPNEVLVTIEAGVEGECHGSVHDRQVTVVSADAWRAACRDLGMEVPWTRRRANLLLAGIDLQDTEGALISIGDVLLEITGENPPCRVMDIQQKGLREALRADWRAGVSCRVLAAGKIEVGDAVRLRKS